MSNFCYGKQKQTSVNLCSAKYLINHFQWRTCQYNIIYFFMKILMLSGMIVFVFVFVLYLYLYFEFSCFHDTRKRSAYYFSLIYENLVVYSNTLNSKKLFKISFFQIFNLKWRHWFENGSKKIGQCCTKGIW